MSNGHLTENWITSNRKQSSGWWDTDLAVSRSTPTFVDQVTGRRLCFLHLRPQHMWATVVGHVYPAGTVVGVSGGDSWDTGGAGRGYSTGPHLCVQTLSGSARTFPRRGRDAVEAA